MYFAWWSFNSVSSTPILAMVETGYRYQELTGRGKMKTGITQNTCWKKIKLAIENGLERRPKRAKSAEHFLTEVLPEMQQAVAAKDTAVFTQNFQAMTANCNDCHGMEEVPFFTVKTPTIRQSPIKK